MASQKSNYFVFLFIALIASFSSYTVAHQDPFLCQMAQDRNLCKTMISGATDWHEAIKNSIKVSLSLAKDLLSKTVTIGPSLVNLQRDKRESVQETCKESFETAVYLLTEAQSALAIGDIGTLHTKLSAAVDTECVDVLSSAGASSFPVANMAKELNTKVSVCLAIMALHVKS